MKKVTVDCVLCIDKEIVHMDACEPFECEDATHTDFVCPKCKAIVTVNIPKEK